MRAFILISLFALTACSGYRTPTMNSDVSRMSTDTLCYRYAYAKSDPKLKDEVAARRVDCDEVLESQAPIGESRY